VNGIARETSSARISFCPLGQPDAPPRLNRLSGVSAPVISYWRRRRRLRARSSVAGRRPDLPDELANNGDDGCEKNNIEPRTHAVGLDLLAALSELSNRSAIASALSQHIRIYSTLDRFVNQLPTPYHQLSNAF